MARHRALNRFVSVALVSVLPLLSSCDKETLMPPEAVDAMFSRYVAIGNSVTAGFQSAGINDSTQLQSYAALLAEAFELDVGTEFVVPELNKPGCPPPLINIFTGEKVGGATAPACALRKAPVPTHLHNVAVPGAAVIDVLTNLDGTSAPNALTTIILGGRTQIEAAADAQPTFVSVAIGNNNVLGAALYGNAALVTPAATFTNTFSEVTADLEDLEVEGGVLMGVFGVTSIPYLSPGVAYFMAAQTPGALPPTFTVANNCAPTAMGGLGQTMLVPFAYGFGILMAQARQGVPVTLDCASNVSVSGYSILTGAEITTIATAIAAYNAAIQAEATRLGWAYYDPNPTLDSLKAAGRIPLFPNATGADAITRPFGDFFSRDGVHPNAAAHRLVAQHLLDAINTTYGLDLTLP